MYNVHLRFWPKLSAKKSFVLIFKSNYLFIYLYLDTCFLYYKGILAFSFEHIVVQEILCDKTQEQIWGILGTTHV